MDQEQFCNKCSQKNDCQRVYESLGNKKGPSIVSKVVFALLMPILIFIGALVICEKFTKNFIPDNKLQTAIGLLTALVITASYVWAAKNIIKKTQDS